MDSAGKAGDQSAEADAGGHRRAARRGGVALRLRRARRGLPPLLEPTSLRCVVQADLEVRRHVDVDHAYKYTYKTTYYNFASYLHRLPQEGGAAAAACGGDARRRPRGGGCGGRRRAAGLLPGPLLPGPRRRAVLQVGRPAELITSSIIPLGLGYIRSLPRWYA